MDVQLQRVRAQLDAAAKRRQRVFRVFFPGAPMREDPHHAVILCRPDRMLQALA